MPYEYAGDPERRLVHVRMWDAHGIGDTGCREAIVIGDPQILASFLELIDLREASSTAITADDLRQIVSSDLGFVSRRAFVTRDTLTYGFARMFESFRAINQAPEQIAVLENLEEAEAWLT